jgi:hypothetical protein
MTTAKLQVTGDRHYFFSLMPPLPSAMSSLPLQGGICMFAKGKTRKPIPILIVYADSIRNWAAASIDLWESAQQHHGAEYFYVHARGDADEAQELIDYYHPVMVRARF